MRAGLFKHVQQNTAPARCTYYLTRAISHNYLLIVCKYISYHIHWTIYRLEDVHLMELFVLKFWKYFHKIFADFSSWRGPTNIGQHACSAPNEMRASSMSDASLNQRDPSRWHYDESGLCINSVSKYFSFTWFNMYWSNDSLHICS